MKTLCIESDQGVWKTVCAYSRSGHYVINTNATWGGGGGGAVWSEAVTSSHIGQGQVCYGLTQVDLHWL